MLSQFKGEAEPVEPHLSLARRRERLADPGSEVVATALSAKLLHAWLQNRHQTLVPLTLNLRVLTVEQRDVVVDGTAALLLAGRARADALERVPAIRQWLIGLGADPNALLRLETALAAPPSLGEVFDRASTLALAIYLYVGAVVAADSASGAPALIADLVQARFDLSTAVVRSAMRRYRR